MRKFIFVLGLLIYIDIVFFGVSNLGAQITWSYKPFIDSFTIDSGIFYIIMAFYGSIGVLAILYPYIKGLQDKNKKLSRSIEKTSIESEDSSDKVKVLEAKIQTLEVALKEALKKD